MGADPDTTDLIVYHGGPIIYAQKVASVYWAARTIYQGGPTPGTNGPGSADGSLIGYFLNHIGGSPYYAINSTYYDATHTFIQNSVTYSWYWADTIEAPVPGDYPNLARIQTQLEIGFTSGALPYDSNTLYLVFSDSGVNLGGGFYFGGRYCAEHTHFHLNGYGDVKYAVMPHDYDLAGCIPESGSPNNDPAADAEMTHLVHEIEEANTDPEIPGPQGAWYDVKYNEVGDKCHALFDTAYTVNGAKANVQLGDRNFYIQRNWENGQPQQCALFSLSINGPTYATAAGNYTWTANPSGSPTAYDYQWQSQDQGSSTWNTLGTGQSQVLYVYGPGQSFTLKVAASFPPGQTQTATVSVNYVPPFTVSLSGPSVVGQWTTCSWTATAENGTGPYTFDWSAPYGTQEHTTNGSDDFSYTSDTENFGVSVTVTDVNGNQAFNSIGVAATGYPGQCG
jgi:hypothetical protein